MSKTKPTQPSPYSADTDLPEGWAACPLGEVATSVKGKRPKNLLPERRPGLIPYIDIRAFETGEYSQFTAPESAKVAPAGDLLIVWDGARSGLVGRMPCEGAVGSTLAAVRLLLVDTDYLHRFLQANFDLINSNTRGTGIPHVDPGVLWSIEFPVAPLAEQKRIVAKVEALLEQVNAARVRLARLPAILQRFRQSVLAAACSGQLTAEWREDAASPSTGSELLRKIDRERRAARAQSRSSRRRESDDDSSGAPPVNWEVPDTWEWAKTSDLLHYERSAAYGVLQPGPDVPNGVPFVRVGDLVNGTVDTSQIKLIAPDIDRQYPRTRLQGDEVLVSLVGTVGRIAVVPKELAGANVARAIGMLPMCPHVLSQYLRFALEHPAKNAELVDLAREVARKTLNLGVLKAVTVPLPTLDEQREIVRRVEALFALADGIEAHLRAATVRAERLPQAILARAFRGELVPTEAELAAKEGRDYEPASVFLERIQEARKQHRPAKHGRGGKKMAKRSTGRRAARKRRPLDEILREQGKPLTAERLFDLAGFDQGSVDEFYEQLRKLVQDGKVRENRPNNKDVTLEAVET